MSNETKVSRPCAECRYYKQKAKRWGYCSCVNGAALMVAPDDTCPQWRSDAALKEATR